MRVDVRERTRRAAEQELEFNDTLVVLLARPLADELRVWSHPVQVMVQPTDGRGIVDMIVRRLPGDMCEGGE